MGVLCAGLACAAGSPALLCIGAADAVFSPFPGPYKMGSDGAHDDKHDGDDGKDLHKARVLVQPAEDAKAVVSHVEAVKQGAPDEQDEIGGEALLQMKRTK